MTGWIGIGVAGNFAGHLEQAGEASDFLHVSVSDAAAPKGLFPFYVPNAEGFLSRDPMSSDRLIHPGDDSALQIEPEIGLWCEVEWSGERVSRVRPTHFGAHDDCSIRRPGARKISEKKNWGPCSKGFSATRLPLDHFGPGGHIDHYRLCSYLERDGELHAYGIDSAVTSYSYFHERLLDWVVDRMNDQRDDGPLESIRACLEVAGRPRRALISIGATRYTDFGESHFLLPGDRAIVIAYDGRRHDPPAIRKWLEDTGSTRERERLEGASVLCQTVESGAGPR